MRTTSCPLTAGPRSALTGSPERIRPSPGGRGGAARGKAGVRMSGISRLLPLAAVCCVLGTGCKGDTTSPGNNNGNNPPPPTYAPPVPVPSSTTSGVPATSDTATVITFLPGVFRPILNRIRGSWALADTACVYGDPPINAAVVAGNLKACYPATALDTAWDSSSYSSPDTVSYADTVNEQPYLYGIYTEVLRHPISWPGLSDPMNVRLVLDSAGMWMPRIFFRDSAVTPDQGTCQPGPNSVFPCFAWTDVRTRRLSVAVRPESVFVRRDVWWQAVPFEGTNSTWEVVDPGFQNTYSWTYTSGTDTTQTASFDSTLSVSLHAGFLAASVDLSATLEQQFSSSVDISRETSLSGSTTLQPDATHTTVFVVWELMERYTLTDRNGNELSGTSFDPNYDIKPDTLNRQGVAIYEKATEF
jgi:hypothetical protein